MEMGIKFNLNFISILLFDRKTGQRELKAYKMMINSSSTEYYLFINSWGSKIHMGKTENAAVWGSGLSAMAFGVFGIIFGWRLAFCKILAILTPKKRHFILQDDPKIFEVFAEI